MDQQDVEKFAKEHGNKFHAQVVSFLRKNDWSVTVSPFYRDIATDKAREADVFADKVVEVPRFAQPTISFPVTLVIECKYVKQEILFWFDKKDADQTNERITKDIPDLKNNANIAKHHWNSVNEVAKLFATYNPNRDERQPENEIIFSSIDKVLNCLIYYRNTFPRRSTIPPGANSEPRIHYPVIIVDSFSKMFRTTLDYPERVEPLDQKIWFPVEVNYAYILYGQGQKYQHLEYFLVDIVNYTKLGEYLALLEGNDIGAAKSVFPQ